jgi:hypothetical protein
MSGYGAVENMQADPAGRRPMPKFLAPVILIILAGCACVLAASMYRADQQMSQVVAIYKAAVLETKNNLLGFVPHRYLLFCTFAPVAARTQCTYVNNDLEYVKRDLEYVKGFL